MFLPVFLDDGQSGGVFGDFGLGLDFLDGFLPVAPNVDLFPGGAITILASFRFSSDETVSRRYLTTCVKNKKATFLVFYSIYQQQPSE
jgi:hypothetical protein